MMLGADLHAPVTPWVMQAMQLDWQHACKGKGCSDKLCELCMHSPSRRCSSNTKPKYASGDYIKSTCEEAPDVVLLDATGNRFYPPRGSRLQIMMLDDRKLDELLDQQGIKRSDKQSDGPLLSSLFRDKRELLNQCVVDRPLLKWRSGSAVPSVVLPLEGGHISLSGLQCVKPYKADPATKQSGQTTKYHLWIQATDEQGSPLGAVSNHIISDVFTLVTTRAKGAAKSIIPQPWEGVAMLDGLGRDAVEALRTLGQKVDAAVGLPEQLGSVTKVKQFWQLVAWVNHAGGDSQARQQQLLKDTKIKQADFRNAAEHVQRTAFIDYRPRVWWRPGTNNTAGLLFACDNSEIQLSLGPIARVVKRAGQPDELAALQAVQLQHPAVQQAVQLALQAWRQPGHGGSWGVYWLDAASEPWLEDADPWAEKALGPSLGTFSMQQLPACVLAAAGVEQGAVDTAAVAALHPEPMTGVDLPMAQQQEKLVEQLQQQPERGEDAAAQQLQLQHLMLQGSAWPEEPSASAPYAFGNVSSTTATGLAQQQPTQPQQLQQLSTATQQSPAAASLGILTTASCPAAAFSEDDALDLPQIPAGSFVTSPLATTPSAATTLSKLAAATAAGAGFQPPSAAAGCTSRDSAEQQQVRYSRAVITEAPRAAAPNAAVQFTPAAAPVQAVHTAAGQAVQLVAVQTPSSATAIQALLSTAAVARIPVGPPPGAAVAAAAATPGNFMALLVSEGLADAAAAAKVVNYGQAPMQQELRIADAAPGTAAAAAAAVDARRQEMSTPSPAAAAALVEHVLLQPVLPDQASGGTCALNAAAAAAGVNGAEVAAPHPAAAAGAVDPDAASICAALKQAIHHDDDAQAAAAGAVDLEMSLGDLSGFSGSSFKLEELLQFGRDLQSADLHFDSLLAGGSLSNDGADLKQQQQQLPLQQQHEQEWPGQPEGAAPGTQELIQEVPAAAAAEHSDASGQPADSDPRQTRSLTRGFNSLNDRCSKPMQLRRPLTALQQRQQQQAGIGQGREQQPQLLEKKRDRQQRKEPAVPSAAAAASATSDKAYGSDKQQQQAGCARARPSSAVSVAAATATVTGRGEHADGQHATAAAAAAGTAGRSNSVRDSSLGLEGLIGFEQIINQGLLETMAATDKPQQEQQQTRADKQQQQQQIWQGMGFNWSTPPGVSGPEDFTAAFPASLMGQTASYLSPVNNVAVPSVEMLAADEGEDLIGLSGLMSTLELEHAPPTRKARA